MFIPDLIYLENQIRVFFVGRIRFRIKFFSWMSDPDPGKPIQIQPHASDIVNMNYELLSIFS